MRILAGAITALRRIVDLGLVVLTVVVLLAIVLGKGAPLVGRQSIVIGGGSMEPAIGLGSTVVIQPVDPAALAVGDVVSMQIGPDRTTYTHRIVEIVDRLDGRWVRTKGDANPTVDPTLVPSSVILGRVEVVVPFAGFVLAVLSLPAGILFVLGLAATLLAVAWLLESIEPERPRGRPGAWRRSGEAVLDRPVGARALVPGDRAPSDSIAAAASTAAAYAAYAAYARPTVREQLARSREERSRRGRWLEGRAAGRQAAD